MFIDEILLEGRLPWLRPLLIAMGLTAAVRLSAVALGQAYLTRLEIRLAMVESLGFLGHVFRLPIAFFHNRLTGDLVSRAISAPRVISLISGELAMTAVSLVTVLVYVAVMIPYDPLLAAVGMAIGSANLIVLARMSRWRADRNRAIEQLRGRLFAGATWAIRMIESVKAGGGEPDLVVRWAADQARMTNAEQVLGAVDVLLGVMPSLLASLTAISVLGLGGCQVIEGSLSIGVLVAVQSLLAEFHQPFRDVARLGADVQKVQADLERIDDVRNQPADINAGSQLPLLEGREKVVASSVTQRLSGQIEFRQVTFGYNRAAGEPLIKDFSLCARPGQRIALVGASGSGKSTIGRLAAGLYRPWSGEILYDGVVIEQVPREVFVGSVALVDQEICLFEGSIRDNLTLWDDLVPPRQLIEACVDAAVHRDLLGRRGGYHATVAEQARNFSGGQRQRLQIARALVHNPCLVVLDEATSAFDPRAERIVDDNLRRRGCTCLIISHRLTTLRDCDEIIVLSAGRVVERGTHAELIADPRGEYSRLISHQALPESRRIGLPLQRRSVSGRARPLLEGHTENVGRAEHDLDFLPRGESASGDGTPRFLIEELLPYSELQHAAANLPLSLDDPGAVWWVSSGAVDVFFVQPEEGALCGRRRHLCRVEEGGSIFALSGVRGQAGSGLIAVGAGPAQLLKFARGDLIRLSFDEGLTTQVAALLDDWLTRVSRALTGPTGSDASCRRLDVNASAALPARTRYTVRGGIAWVRHLRGASLLLDVVRLRECDMDPRFPLTDYLWLTAESDSEVTLCDTATIIRAGDPWAGLDVFHRAILDFVAGVEEREEDGRWAESRRTAARACPGRLGVEPVSGSGQRNANDRLYYR